MSEKANSHNEVSPMETKYIQIDKIFQLIEKNKDNLELSRVAIETLMNKCFETSVLIFPVLKNILNIIKKGNIKLIEECEPLINNIFNEFDIDKINKIIRDSALKNNILELINENTKCPLYFDINEKKFKYLYTMFYSDYIKNNVDISSYENLYRDEINSSSEMDLKYTTSEQLFKNDLLFFKDKTLKKELLDSMSLKKTTSMNESYPLKENIKKPSVAQLYQSQKYMTLYDFDKSIYYKLKGDEYGEQETKNKKKKLKNDMYEKICYIKVYPFFGFYYELLSYDHSINYNKRRSAATFLLILYRHLMKILYTLYDIEIKLEISENDKKSNIQNLQNINIISVNIKQKLYISDDLMEKIQINIISHLIYNSVLDKVVDYDNVDYLFVYKDINLQLCAYIINDLKSDILIEKLLEKLIKDLNKYIEENKDWQQSYAILTLFKYLLTEQIDSKVYNLTIAKDLINILQKTFKIGEEDILILSIKILNKILEENYTKQILEPNAIYEIFNDFVSLTSKFDDIAMGLKDYFSCFYSFILFFSKFEYGKKEEKSKIFLIFDQILNENFVIHAFNKMDKVRLKFFELFNQILVDGFEFKEELMEKLILIAFQGICIEEEKTLLKTLQSFLINTLTFGESYKKSIEFFRKNTDIIFRLFLTENINKEELLYIPEIADFSFRSEAILMYRSFFLDDMEVNKIRVKYLKKVSLLIPIFGLILLKDQEFFNIFLSHLNVSFVDNENLQNNNTINNMNNNNNDYTSLILSHSLHLSLQVYLAYLEFCETQRRFDKLLTSEILEKLSNINSLNNIPVIVNISYETKNLVEEGMKLGEMIKSFGIPNEPQNLNQNFDNLMTNGIFNKQKLESSLKTILEFVKINKKDQIKSIFEMIKNVKNSISILEDRQNIEVLRQKIRVYASACLFMHNSFERKTDQKISDFTNAILFNLKLNEKETKKIIRLLLRLIYTTPNNETKNKIITLFLDNSVNIFIQKMKDYNDNININNNNNEKEYKFLPIKYFFKEYAIVQRYVDMRQIFELFSIHLHTNDDRLKDIKILSLLYMLIPIKLDVLIISMDVFKDLLSRIETISHINEFQHLYLKVFANIIYNGKKIIQDFDLKMILKVVFGGMEINNRATFRLINELMDNDTISLNSIDYIFRVLRFINNNLEDIRKDAVSIFSKQMKIISVLKLENDYSEITKTNSNVQSLSFIKDLITQNVSLVKDLKINLKIKLRTYQMIGINWLLFLGQYYLGLALCDEMGLGKTIQTLAAVAHSTVENLTSNQKQKNLLSLIVCPNTLINNWLNECEKFFYQEEVKLIPITNINDFTRFKNSIKDSKLKKNNKAKVLILITSYERVRDFEFDFLQQNKSFYYLILDEAHLIKNNKTKTYMKIKKLRADKRIILTGTPIQNNVMELWSLFDILMPGFLGSENDFEIKYHKKLTMNIKKLNLEEKLQENIFQTSLLEIRKRIKPFILRRLKTDVLKELPDKIISDYDCEMTEEQAKMYENFENENNIKISEDNPNEVNKPTTLENFNKLRKICNHPCLIKLESELKGRLSETQLSSLFNKHKKEILHNSGKLLALEQLLSSLGFESEGDNLDNDNLNRSNSNINTNISTDNNNDRLLNNNNGVDYAQSYDNKVLIFTQYKSMLKVIKFFFDNKFPRINALTLSGDVKVKERGDVVNRFNNDQDVNVLILTTNIGGLGLNLTSANIVIMYDHNWNPSIDMQAIDRAHRIGQKKIVQVFRLITLRTIEERLINLQLFKKYIADKTIGENKISDTNINANSFMQSLENFAGDRISSEDQEKERVKNKEKKHLSRYDAINDFYDEIDKNDEVEMKFLKKLIEQKQNQTEE